MKVEPKRKRNGGKKSKEPKKIETKSRSLWQNVTKSPIFADIPHSLCQIMNIAIDLQ